MDLSACFHILLLIQLAVSDPLPQDIHVHLNLNDLQMLNMSPRQPSGVGSMNRKLNGTSKYGQAATAQSGNEHGSDYSDDEGGRKCSCDYDLVEVCGDDEKTHDNFCYLECHKAKFVKFGKC